MNFYVGNTDRHWFNFLRREPREDVNFWKPLGDKNFKAIPLWSPFLLKLKKPNPRIVGLGTFVGQMPLALSDAWATFGPRNGFPAFEEFAETIRRYREANNKPVEFNPRINCLVLNAPVFFEERDWLPIPDNWHDSIVTGKVYSTQEPIGQQLWATVEALLAQYRPPVLA